jgi:hypothetical protein
MIDNEFGAKPSHSVPFDATCNLEAGCDTVNTLCGSGNIRFLDVVVSGRRSATKNALFKSGFIQNLQWTFCHWWSRFWEFPAIHSQSRLQLYIHASIGTRNAQR